MRPDASHARYRPHLDELESKVTVSDTVLGVVVPGALGAVFFDRLLAAAPPPSSLS